MRRRIRSIRNTAQITRAMQMVAAAKMRRAQQSALAGRPYSKLMNRVISEVSARTGDLTHPFLEPGNSDKRCVIIVSTDKGLCGALNANLFREITQFDTQNTLFITAGKKASQFIARTKRQLIAEFYYKDSPQFSEARAISRFAQNLFLEGKVQRIDILFNNFVSTIVQKPHLVEFLPVGKIEKVSTEIPGKESKPETEQSGFEFLFEPSAEQVLGAMLPHYLNFKVYQILLEAKASEHSARMIAMKNATDNAAELIKELTIKYNKVRQAAITKEILEISTAQMGME
ncbi:MAG TPA: ATP synthase F1 subunit gamma [Verrucomicrobiota bacterium]|nr:ATP synthase F1 subunit gamma [Verrucomicrobiota bacterium]